MEHEGKWGYICPSQWTQLNSFVLCGQLGFPNAEKLKSHKETIQDLEPVYWLDQVTCKGWESSIVSCDHAGWGSHQCEEGEAVRIECVRRLIKKVSILIQIAVNRYREAKRNQISLVLKQLSEFYFFSSLMLSFRSNLTCFRISLGHSVSCTLSSSSFTLIGVKLLLFPIVINKKQNAWLSKCAISRCFGHVFFCKLQGSYNSKCGQFLIGLFSEIFNKFQGFLSR